VLLLDHLEMPHEVRLDGLGQHRDAVLVALAAPHGYPVGREIDVLDPEAGALEEAKPSTVQEDAHQADGPVKLPNDGAHLFAREDHRQTRRLLGSDDPVEPGQLLLEHVTVEKEQSAQRLVLGGGGDVSLDGQ
jgi:hypothetical protein